MIKSCWQSRFMVAGLFLRTPLCLPLPPAYHVGSHFTPTCVPSVLVFFVQKQQDQKLHPVTSEPLDQRKPFHCACCSLGLERCEINIKQTGSGCGESSRGIFLGSRGGFLCVLKQPPLSQFRCIYPPLTKSSHNSFTFG